MRADVAKEQRMARRAERRTISRFVAEANEAAEAHSLGQEVGDWEEGDGWRRCQSQGTRRWEEEDEEEDEEMDFEYGSEVDVEDEGLDPSESDVRQEDPRYPGDGEDGPGGHGGASGASSAGDVLMVM